MTNAATQTESPTDSAAAIRRALRELAAFGNTQESAAVIADLKDMGYCAQGPGRALTPMGEAAAQSLVEPEADN